MSTRTSPIRVSSHVHDEVMVASQIMGVTSAAVMEQAWSEFKNSPQFREAFLSYQRGFASGDLSSVAVALNEQARKRGKARAKAANA